MQKDVASKNIIKKAKEIKKNRGVGRNFVKLSNSGDDMIIRVMNKNNELIKILSRL